VDDSDVELLFIAGKILEKEIPKEKRYLLRYFKTPLQEAFLRYYLVVGNYTRFEDHTGFHCNQRWKTRMTRRLEILQEKHFQAKSNFDIEELERIERGKIKVTEFY
jgi:hypothetical protein